MKNKEFAGVDETMKEFLIDSDAERYWRVRVKLMESREIEGQRGNRSEYMHQKPQKLSEYVRQKSVTET